MTNDSDHLYLDRSAIQLLSTRLRDILDRLLDELDNVITRQVAFSDRSAERSGTDSETPLAFNDHASEISWALRDTVRSWTLHVCTARNLTWPGDGRAAHFASWLDKHLIDLALTSEAPQAFDEISHIWKEVCIVVDRPGSKEFVGRCQSDAPEVRCTGIYVRPDTQRYDCRACGVVSEVPRMRSKLLDALGQRTYTASELASALSIRAEDVVPFERIRNWVRRGQLTPAEPTGHDVPRYSLDRALDLYNRNPPRRRSAS